ncbi:MAG: YqgE/AlgH family protein [Simkaniaceae bacterium]|nr:MAG: YqgE/AlgH family protein [Simkaniaceae bacterium]
MKSIPYSELKKGTFLIASPDIGSGIFYRSVVLLCDHSAVGSFGLIINKPLDIEVEDDFLGIGNGEDPLEMRAGGPNQPNQIMLLQNQGYEDETSLQIAAGIYLNGDMEMLQEEEREAPLTLVCFGYGGWASGVLEREFLKGAWYLCPAKSKHLFQTSPETLWQTLLREMGGKYKTLSLMPEDLDLN